MKTHRLFIVSIACITSLCGCSTKPQSNTSPSFHDHVFQQIIDEDHLVEPADMYHGNGYQKVCSCGEISSEVYYEDEPLKYCFSGKKLTKNKTEIVDFYNTSIISFLVDDKASFIRESFLYESTDINNERIVLSGAITIPLLNNRPNVKGFIIDSHPTLDDANNAPSVSWTPYSIGVVANCVVMEFDLQGYGETLDYVADYHCRHLSNKNTIDGAYAAFNLVKEKYNIEKGNLPFYNTGYSQGGYSSLALLKYLQEDATEEEKEFFNFERTFSGSGAYDPYIMIEESLANQNLECPEYIVMALISFYDLHEDSFKGLQLTEFLTPFGLEIADAIKTKKLSEMEKIKNKKDGDGNILFNSLENIFTEKLLTKDEYLFAIIKDLLNDESLLNNNWIPEGNLFLYYSTTDEIITPKCTLKAIELFDGKIKEGTIEIYDDNVGHVQGGTNFYAAFILNVYGKLNG